MTLGVHHSLHVVPMSAQPLNLKEGILPSALADALHMLCWGEGSWCS